MARIFIMGSSEGPGLLAGQLRVAQGHEVVFHARSAARAADARAALPAADAVVDGNVATLAGMRQVAAQANALRPFDAVVATVGIGYREPKRIATADGLPHVCAINVPAPSVLTALMRRRKRLVAIVLERCASLSGIKLGDPR